MAAFLDTHFQVDAVAHHIHFSGVEVVENVAVVVVEIAHSVFVLGEALMEQCLVVDIAFLHLQDALEDIGVVDRVAHPADVANVIFLSLAQVEVYVHMAIVHLCHTVAFEHGIAVTPGVESLQHVVFVLVILLGKEFLRFEEVQQCALMGFLHGALEFGGFLGRHAGDIDAVDVHFAALVDVDIHQHAVVGCGVFFLLDVDFGVLESLLVEVALDDDFGAIDHIGRNLTAVLQTEALLEVFAFRLLHAAIADGADARLGGEMNVEVDAVVHDAIGRNLDVGEELLLPVAAHGVSDVGAGNGVDLAHFEAGDALQEVVVVARDFVHGEAAEDVFRGRDTINDVGLTLHIAHLCLSGGDASEGQGGKEP